jgi:hypothetical protein
MGKSDSYRFVSPITREMLDKDIRGSLRQYLANVDPAAVVLEELPLCRSGRADCAAVNGDMRGFEIKSDHDSLRRLPEQVPRYQAVFDYCTVVIAARHMKHIRHAVPEEWGILVMEYGPGESALQHVRKPRRNRKTDIEALIGLMWKMEAVSALRNQGIRINPSRPVRDVWSALQRLPKDVVAQEARGALKSRA